METKLKFLQTMTVDEFKTAQGVNKIEVLRSDISGKAFIAFGFEKGACSQKALSGELTNPVVSHVCAPDTGDTFWLLHQRGEGGATLLGVL